MTAQQARAYKPERAPFPARARADRRPRERILHVAQSLFHDHVLANRLGLARSGSIAARGTPGSGATPPAEATPDATYPDMRSFADAAA